MASKEVEATAEVDSGRTSEHTDVENAAPIEKVQTNKSGQMFVPPNGGLRAWLCVLGGFCCLFTSFGFLNACGIFQLYYEENLLRDHDSSSITWITTIALFLMYLLGPVFGVIADKKGAKVILIPASILVIFAICMLSLSTQYYQIMLSEGIAFGLGAGGLFLTPMIAVGRWFTTKRGLATGIVASGSGLGGVIFPIFIPRMIEQHGFAGAVRWLALLMGCMLVIAVLTVSAPDISGTTGKKMATSDTFLADFKKPYWITWFVGVFFFWWGFFAPFNFIPLFAAVRGGASANMANNISSILNAFSVVGRILPGYLGDKLGQFNVMIGVSLLSGISTLVFWLPIQYHPNEAATIAFGGFYGFVSGGFISLMTPCIVALCKGKLGDLGKRLGVFMFIMAFAALASLPIQGAIKDSEAPDDFSGLIAFAGACMVFGGSLIAAAAIALRREVKIEQR